MFVVVVVVVFCLVLHVAIFEPKRLKSGHLRLRSKYFTSKRSERVKYFSTREEKFRISPGGHVMLYLLYKHQ